MSPSVPQTVRPAAVAGMFYSGDEQELAQQINSYLQTESRTEKPIAIVSPHAGYVYSGATAGKAWKQAANRAEELKRIALLGPSHRVAFRGIATSPASYWQTPLGNIELDNQAAQHIENLPFVGSSEQAHAQEHSLEVQVPFIQTLFPQAKLLPLVVGDATPKQVQEVLELFWGKEDTLIAVSSDLSHYHDYRTSQLIDSETSKAIESCNTAAIGPEQACGCRPLNGLLKLVEKDGRQVATLALCNSGDTAGDKQKVVGYGAYSIH